MSRSKPIFWVILLLAAVLRFLTLGDRPFDGDEGVILKIAEMPISELIKAVAVDVHPPLYHLLVHASISLFGVSEWSVRLVGVLAGIGLVALAKPLGSTLPDRQAGLRVPGWLLGLLLPTSPYLVNLSQDARMYSLLVFLSAALWVATHRLATDRSASWLGWVGWSLLALAIVYTHHIGWLIVGFYGVLVLWNGWSNVKSQMSKVSTALAVLLLGYLPILSTTIAQVQGRLGEQSATAGIGETVKGVIGGLYRMLAGRTFLDLNPSALIAMITENPLAFAAFIFTLLVPLYVLIVGLVGRSGNSSEVAYDDSSEVKEEPSWRQEALIVIACSFLIAMFVGSIGTQASRYLSYLAPLLYGFLALGMWQCWPRAWGKAAAVVVALTFIAGLWTQYAVHNQAAGIDAYVQAIEADLQPGDSVVLRGAFAGGESRAYEYYRALCERDVDCEKSAPDRDSFGVPVIDMYYSYDVRESNLDELKAAQPLGEVTALVSMQVIKRVWYFDMSYQQPTLEQLPAGFTSEVIVLDVTDKEGKPLLLTKVSKQ